MLFTLRCVPLVVEIILRHYLRISLEAKKYHKCVDKVFVNFFEIFSPRCNLDIQFSELHS